jgi:hypothetical protein
MFLNNSVDSVPTVYLIFVDDMLNVSEDGYDWGKQYSLACTSTSLGRVSSRPIALPDHFFCFRCGRGHDSRSGDPDKLLLLILMEKTIFYSYFIGGADVELKSLHLAVPSLNCGLHTVSNGRHDTCSSTRRDMKDLSIFEINSRICMTTASIGRRTVLTMTTCHECTTRISIYKFLK